MKAHGLFATALALCLVQSVLCQSDQREAHVRPDPREGQRQPQSPARQRPPPGIGGLLSGKTCTCVDTFLLSDNIHRNIRNGTNMLEDFCVFRQMFRLIGIGRNSMIDTSTFHVFKIIPTHFTFHFKIHLLNIQIMIRMTWIEGSNKLGDYFSGFDGKSPFKLQSSWNIFHS